MGQPDYVLAPTTLRGNEAIGYMAVVAHLEAVLRVSPKLVPLALDSPLLASLVDRANKGDLRDGYEQTRLLLASAEDHLTTISMVVKNNTLPIFALYSLLRPAGEAVVGAAHLLDPKIDETRRLARGLNARFENLQQQHKVVPDDEHFSRRIAHIEARAAGNGIEPIRSNPKAGEPAVIGFGEHPKKEIELFRTYFEEGELLYRFLSAHVHCLPWVKMPGAPAPMDEPGMSLLHMELDTRLFGSTLTLVLNLHERNLIQLLGLAGYPRLVWAETMKTALAASTAEVTARSNKSSS